MNVRQTDDDYHPEKQGGLRRQLSAYNKGQLAALGFIGSLGGLAFGYNSCIAASALFLIEKQFPKITSSVRLVS